ncbi:hypothetical protein ACRAWF_24150 [Streptomyces sp. L7]
MTGVEGLRRVRAKRTATQNSRWAKARSGRRARPAPSESGGTGAAGRAPRRPGHDSALRGRA